MIRVDLKTHECGPEGLPADLQGLTAESLRDLSWTDPALGYHGVGYWPLVEVRPNLAFGQEYENPTFVVDADAGFVHRQWCAVPLSAEALQQLLAQRFEQMVRQIDAERETRIAQGKPHTFPDGLAGTVQLRHERDIINVNAVGSAAMMMISAGDTETKMEFRDQEDVTHQMTAHEILAMAQDVMGWISSQYAAAWTHKDAIKELVEAADGEGVASYDITQGWPQDAS